jgi:hypothetical protein
MDGIILMMPYSKPYALNEPHRKILDALDAMWVV